MTYHDMPRLTLSNQKNKLKIATATRLVGVRDCTLLPASTSNHGGSTSDSAPIYFSSEASTYMLTC